MHWHNTNRTRINKRFNFVDIDIKSFWINITKTGLAPECSTTFAVEIHVKAGTMTSSPLSSPRATNAKCIAEVQDDRDSMRCFSIFYPFFFKFTYFWSLVQATRFQVVPERSLFHFF